MHLAANLIFSAIALFIFLYYALLMIKMREIREIRPETVHKSIVVLGYGMMILSLLSIIFFLFMSFLGLI